MNQKTSTLCGEIMGRVAIVTYPPFDSGLTQYSFFLLKAIIERGNWKNIFLVCNKHDEYNTSFSGNIAGIIHRTRLLPLSVARLLFFIISERINIVHFQSFFKYPSLTYFLIRIFQIFGKTVIFTAHDIFPHYQRPWDRYFTAKIYEKADGIIVHSKANQASILEIGHKRGETRMIYHPLYSNFNCTEHLDKISARQKIGLGKNRRVLLFFGRIDRRKGAETFIREFPKLLKKNPDCHFVLAGRDGFPKGHLTSIASELEILDNITIMDKFIAEKDVTAYFSAADAVVLPYLRGSTSGVLKIAFAHKTPVIATRVGELPEFVKEYHAGVLIDLPFKEKDVDAVLSLLSGAKNDLLYHNYQRLLEDFSWETAAKKTESFYENIGHID